ncbi:MAG: hypothetical protein QT02_C0004G0028 [archaeon GW2011_AR9]|nr:MAG: hypothetical protein QT02_C0004G0028 [archaeon GW2011_AR9]MBS3120403.1 hypothetical protein [Candidatus Woesearchaeota archaeon]HIG93839.1 hypothetical protein [Candidatus Woesearchaeota archaeon]HIH12790.1 hypothetical protein [Candidatus Woesearchaeota archaeon]
MTETRCPSCKSTKVTLYMGGQFGKYICKNCGYVGNLILEEVRSKPKEKASSKFLLGYSLLFSFLFLAFFGIVTFLIPTPFFTRMTPKTFFDYGYWILTSALFGTYIAFYCYNKKAQAKCTVTAAGGGIFGFLGFGCAVCNKLLLLLFGAVGVLTYIEPIKPLLGLAGTALLGYAVYQQGRNVF